MESNGGKVCGVGLTPKYVERRNMVWQEQIRLGGDNLVETSAHPNALIDIVYAEIIEVVVDKIRLWRSVAKLEFHVFGCKKFHIIINIKSTSYKDNIMSYFSKYKKKRQIIVI